MLLVCVATCYTDKEAAVCLPRQQETNLRKSNFTTGCVVQHLVYSEPWTSQIRHG